MQPLVLFATPLLLAASAAAQTVTVTTSQDVIDVNFFTATIADLPGPDGKVSFLEAIIATNNTAGHQTIAFNIPQSDWGLQFLYPGAAVIVAGPNGFNATDSVTIDGTTQTAFTGDTNPVGAEVAIYHPFGTLGASLGGDGSVLMGLHSGEWSVWGDGCLVTGNTGGMHVNVGGDGTLVQGNQAGTIKVDGATDATITGNTMSRVRIWASTNTRVGGPTLAERNFITGYGTTNSEGLPAGTDVELWSTTDTVIENNYIGTTVDGMSRGNTFQTIGIEVDTGNTGLRVRDNLIAGVLGTGQGPHYAGTLWGWAVYFQGSGSDVEFSGNTIGLDAAGAATLPSVWGVHTASCNYTDVRFLNNVIAGHYFTGVTVGQNAPAVRLQGNRLFGNAFSGSGFLGIDLIGPDLATGVTPNDPGDTDTGGNGLQNFPVLADAALETGGTRVTGTLDSTPLTAFTLEFFASSACDPSGHGQAELLLGSTAVTTDAAGLATFDALVGAAPSGSAVTATATREPIGATSEFAACVFQTEPDCAVDMGYGGPGVSTLSLCGEPLATGQTARLSLDGAPPLAPTWIQLGTTFDPTPFAGGTFVAVPGKLVYLGRTDETGSLSFDPVRGGGGPATVYLQALYLDVTQPDLLGLTNALEVRFLP